MLANTGFVYQSFCSMFSYSLTLIFFCFLFYSRAFAGKTIFVSGGSRGIGKAIALKIAKDGANVVIAAKTTEPHPKLEGTIFTAAKEGIIWILFDFENRIFKLVFFLQWKQLVANVYLYSVIFKAKRT